MPNPVPETRPPAPQVLTNTAQQQANIALANKHAQEQQERASQKQVSIYITGSVIHDGKSYHNESLELPEQEAKRLVDLKQAVYGTGSPSESTGSYKVDEQGNRIPTGNAKPVMQPANTEHRQAIVDPSDTTNPNESKLPAKK